MIINRLPITILAFLPKSVEVRFIISSVNSPPNIPPAAAIKYEIHIVLPISSMLKPNFEFK